MVGRFVRCAALKALLLSKLCGGATELEYRRRLVFGQCGLAFESCPLLMSDDLPGPAGCVANRGILSCKGG